MTRSWGVKALRQYILYTHCRCVLEQHTESGAENTVVVSLACSTARQMNTYFSSYSCRDRRSIRHSLNVCDTAIHFAVTRTTSQTKHVSTKTHCMIYQYRETRHGCIRAVLCNYSSDTDFFEWFCESAFTVLAIKKINFCLFGPPPNLR